MASIAGANAFAMVAGDTKTLAVSVTDPAGAVVDIAGATIRFGLAKTPGDTVVVAKATGDGIEITNGAGGVFEVELDGADTEALAAGTYWYECEITAGSAIGTVVRDVVRIDAAVLAAG